MVKSMLLGIVAIILASLIVIYADRKFFRVGKHS